MNSAEIKKFLNTAVGGVEVIIQGINFYFSRFSEKKSGIKGIFCKARTGIRCHVLKMASIETECESLGEFRIYYSDVKNGDLTSWSANIFFKYLTKSDLLLEVNNEDPAVQEVIQRMLKGEDFEQYELIDVKGKEFADE